MVERTMQLVLHYDGTDFSGWQRQPDRRTVQGAVEDALARLGNPRTAALGSGRTDAGVHARGQAVGVRAPERWTPHALRRALNAVLPQDVWVARAFEMQPEFHARYSAVARRYTYHVATGDDAASPFRRRYAFACEPPLDLDALREAAAELPGTHVFRGFAVKGTAPESDDHRCTISHASWSEGAKGLVFAIESNRFLHHMVRFLVGTMLDMARGRRPVSDMPALLAATDNSEVSPPAPPHALFLDTVRYPESLYISGDAHADVLSSPIIPAPWSTV
jgi:tRNA pseudouridine38-40 synthase